jgi:hypothetical protein
VPDQTGLAGLTQVLVQKTVMTDRWGDGFPKKQALDCHFVTRNATLSGTGFATLFPAARYPMAGHGGPVMSASKFTAAEVGLLAHAVRHVKIPPDQPELLRWFLAGELARDFPALATKVVWLGADDLRIFAMKLHRGDAPPPPKICYHCPQCQKWAEN